MSLLTHSEALTVSDAFLCSLYGDDMFGKWRELKLEMRFVTERDYISWLLEVANYYRNEENLTQTTNNAESGKVEVASEVRADDNCNKSQQLLVDQQQKLQLNSLDHEPSDGALCQSERLVDNDEVVDQQGMSTSFQNVSSRDGSLNQEFTGDADCLPTKMPVLQPRPCVVNMCDNNVFYMPQQLPGRVKRANHHVKKKQRNSQNHLSSPDCESPPKLKSYRSGDKIHKCNGCNYSSASITDLIRHKRMHTGEKPYRCDKCPYAAAQASLLVAHKRRHTGEKPYRCDKCPYAAAVAGNLMEHKRTHTGEKPYRCDKCPYAAAQAGNLVEHKRRHTGEKPYRCDKCPYATAHAGNLVVHKRKHTGEKPYRCDKCPYAGAHAGDLVRHKRKHTGEKPYRCDKCTYAAAQASNLVVHKLKHTG